MLIFFATSEFDWPITLKKYIYYWPSYIGERRTTFAKTYGIKARCYGKKGWGTN
jgi:hypothetical protein